MGRWGWKELTSEKGIRRDHRVHCKSSSDHKPGRRCDCPFSFAPSGGGKRVTGVASLAEAKSLKAQHAERARRAREAGAPTAAMPTLMQWTAHVLRVKEGTVKPNTVDSYAEAYAARLHAHLGHLRLDAITPLVIDDWIASRIAVEGNTASVFKAFQFLRLALNMAAKKRVIDFAATSAVDYPTKDKPPVRESRERAITRVQYATLLGVYSLASHRIMVRLAVEAGLRSGELAGLRFHHLDLEGKHPSILVEDNVTTSRRTREKVTGTPKSGKAGTVAITPGLAAELCRYRQWLEAAEGVTDRSYLFPGRIGRRGRTSHDNPQGRWTPGNNVERLCKRAGLLDEDGKPLTTPHGLRATGATLAAEAGVNPLVIQHQLRHQELRTTQRHYIGTPPPAVLAEYGTAFE